MRVPQLRQRWLPRYAVPGSAASARCWLDIPEDWSEVEISRFGPFVTDAVFERPDRTRVTWSSRRHRKRQGTARSWLIGGGFMIGSVCFALGSLPAYFDNVAPATDAWTFFVGSIFFTFAAYRSYQEVLDAPPGPHTYVRSTRGLARFVGGSPRRIDWWATVIQLVGTVFFNVSTFAATRTDFSLHQQRRLIWGPDVLGSICFLVASWLAFAEVGPSLRDLRHRGIGWWIAALNLLGSIAFGIAAIAARYLTTTGEPANIARVNAGTFIGAVCFFIGAALLPVESTQSPVTQSSLTISRST